jgi:hypothetical protein
MYRQEQPMTSDHRSHPVRDGMLEEPVRRPVRDGMWFFGNTFRPAGTVTSVGIACFYQHIVPNGTNFKPLHVKIFLSIDGF